MVYGDGGRWSLLNRIPLQFTTHGKLPGSRLHGNEHTNIWLDGLHKYCELGFVNGVHMYTAGILSHSHDRWLITSID